MEVSTALIELHGFEATELLTIYLQASTTISPVVASPPPPKGWSYPNFGANAIEAELRAMTSLPNIQLVFNQERGPHYLFKSGPTYYLWDTVMEECGRVQYPKDVVELYDLLEKDLRKVVVKLLPEPEELEG